MTGIEGSYVLAVRMPGSGSAADDEQADYEDEDDELEGDRYAQAAVSTTAAVGLGCGAPGVAGALHLMRSGLA